VSFSGGGLGLDVHVELEGIGIFLEEVGEDCFLALDALVLDVWVVVHSFSGDVEAGG